jgi:hypothetical protein
MIVFLKICRPPVFNFVHELKFVIHLSSILFLILMQPFSIFVFLGKGWVTPPMPFFVFKRFVILDSRFQAREKEEGPHLWKFFIFVHGLFFDDEHE